MKWCVQTLITSHRYRYKNAWSIVVGIFVLLSALRLPAQTLELGVGLGLSSYNGDILAETLSFPKTSGFAGQIQLSLHINERFRAQVFYIRGRLTGSDIDFGRDERNLSFTTNIDEVGLRGFFNLIPFDPYGESGRTFTAYVGTGVTAYHFNPFTTNLQGQKVFLQKLGTAGQYLPDEQNTPRPYSLYQPGIPLTAGLSWAITPRVIVGVEADYRVLFTDYIDDIGQDRYPDFDNLLLSSDQAALLTNRGWEIVYDADLGVNPIDVAKAFYQDKNLSSGFRSVGKSKDVFGFILVKVSFMLDEISFNKKSKFGCYSF